MSVVIYTNRKSGCRYAYESTYRWDPESGQSRPTRRYLGRVDADGNIIPSSHRRGGARTKGPLTLAREAGEARDPRAGAAETADAEGAGTPAEDGAAADELRACRERVRALEAEVASLGGMIDEIRAIVSRPRGGS